jgi:DNA polymerase-3 subunit delta'
LGRACQWARLELADANLYETKKRLLRSVSACEYREALDLAEWLLAECKKIATVRADLEKTTSKTDLNRRAQKALVRVIISALHDAVRLKLAMSETIVNFDQKESIKALAERFDAEQLSEKIANCYRTLRQIESSVNERLIFEQLLLNLAVSDKMRVW